jgi:pimeloyl-ACP methyl ester carboxylesterase
MLTPRDERPPLIYLPGLDGTGRLLHRQPRLHECYRVHCVAYPQNDIHTYADLVDLAIVALEATDGGIILAESFGGAVALMTARKRPDLVRRLVLVNTFAYFPRRGIIQILAGLGRFLPAKPSSPATRPIRGIFFFSPDITASEQQEWWIRTADAPMHAFGRRFQLIADLDLRHRLAEIHIPTLVVAAPDDRVVAPCAGKTLARLLPRARLIQPRVGHGALIHPRMNVADLLEQPRYWDDRSPAAMAASSAGLRLG